jgi:hypothetical protein
MKKSMFFYFVLFFYLGFNIQTTQAVTTEPCENMVISESSGVLYIYEDNILTLKIDDYREFNLSGYQCFNEGTYLFGSVHIDNQNPYYDGFIGYYHDGIVNFEYIDLGYNELLHSLYLLDEELVVRLMVLDESGRDLVVIEERFIQLSENLEFGSYFILDHPIISIEQDHNRLMINDDYEQGSNFALYGDLSTLYPDDEIAVKDVYEGEAEILFLNEAMINDLVYEHSAMIDYPGYYTFENDHQTSTFEVQPSINIIDGMVYVEPVEINLMSGQLFIDGVISPNQTTISSYGLHNLTINGINGYTKTLSFVIDYDVTGVQTNQIYTSDLHITFEGIGYLNHNFVTSPLDISDPGEYILEVVGTNDYTKRFAFEVTEPDSFNISQIVEYLDVGIATVVVVVGILILRKKK